MASNNTPSTPGEQDTAANAQSLPRTPIKSGHISLFSTPTSGTKRGSSPPMRFEPSKRQVGTQQWANTKEMSDLTIWYGEGGKDAYLGHKAFFTSQSIWFQIAVLGDWKEKDAKEMTLEGDDPVALVTMLDACYNHDCAYKTRPDNLPKSYSAAHVLWQLSVYQVADKYKVPNLITATKFQAANTLRHALDSVSKMEATPENVARLGLREIVQGMYEITGHRPRTDPFRHAVLDVIVRHPTMSFLGNKQGPFQAEIRSIGESVHQFGQDIFMMLTNPRPDSFLGIMKEVTCPNVACPRKTQWIAVGVTKSFCMLCGLPIDWKALADAAAAAAAAPTQ